MDNLPAAAAAESAHLAPADRRRVDADPPGGIERRRGRRRSSDALKMACPHCGASESSVVRSRGGIEEDKVGRRRECAECGKRFPTSERVDRELLELELAGRSPVAQLVAAAPVVTWENAERLLHRLWGQAKDRQYVKRDWTDMQQILTGLRSLA